MLLYLFRALYAHFTEKNHMQVLPKQNLLQVHRTILAREA